MNALKNYFLLSRKNTYNFLLAMLLLALYETFKLLFGGEMQVINGVDAWFQYLFSYLPYKTWVLSAVVFLVGLIFFIRDYKAGVRISFGIMFLMLIEATFWATLIFFSLPKGMNYLKELLPMQVAVKSPNLLQQIGLSFGAGFYEELFFRLIMVWGLLLFFKLLGKPQNKFLKNVLIVVITALTFSAVHYIGSLGDEFTWYSFIYRTIFGMIMSIMIIARGFAITSWSHAIYDIFVFTTRSLIL